MTDHQLYLSIGIPSVMALVGILVIGYFGALNFRIQAPETRLDGHIGHLETRWEARLLSPENKFDIFDGKSPVMDNRLTRVEELLKHLH